MAALVNTDDDEGDCSEQNCAADPAVLPTAAPEGGTFTHPLSQTRKGSPVCLSPLPGGHSFLPLAAILGVGNSGETEERRRKTSPLVPAVPTHLLSLEPGTEQNACV